MTDTILNPWGDPLTGAQVAAIPLPPNSEAASESGASTVGGYLIALLRQLWQEEEGFSGKRPFGNSGWTWDLYAVVGQFVGDPGCVDMKDIDPNTRVLDRFIFAAIDSLASTEENPK